MKNKILLIAGLMACSAVSFAQTTPVPPTGSVPYSNQILITPSGTMSTGSVAKMYRVIASAKRVDSLRKVDSIANSVKYELLANKQNSLATDGTNLKYPTVTAVNAGLALKANTTALGNYLPLVGGNMTGDIQYLYDGNASSFNVNAGKGLTFTKNTDYGKVYFESTGDDVGDANLIFENGDNITNHGGPTEGFIFRKSGASEAGAPVQNIAVLNLTQFKYLGNDVWHKGNLPDPVTISGGQTITGSKTFSLAPTFVQGGVSQSNFQLTNGGQLSLSGTTNNYATLLGAVNGGGGTIGRLNLIYNTAADGGSGTQYVQGIQANPQAFTSTNFLPVTTGTLLNSNDANNYAKILGGNNFQGSQVIVDADLTVSTTAGGSTSPTDYIGRTLSGSYTLGNITLSSFLSNGTGSRFTQGLVANVAAITSSSNSLPLSSGTLLNSIDANSFAKLASGNVFTGNNSFTGTLTVSSPTLKGLISFPIESVTESTISYDQSAIQFQKKRTDGTGITYVDYLRPSSGGVQTSNTLPDANGKLVNDVSLASAITTNNATQTLQSVTTNGNTTTTNIGLGVTPTEKMDVNGAVKVRGVATTSVANTGILDFNVTSTRLSSYGANTTTVGGFNILGVSSNSSVVTNYLTGTSNGFVGVNNASPTEALDINGALSIRTGITQNVASTGRLGFQSAGLLVGAWGADASTYGAVNLYQSNSTGTLAHSALYVAPNGNINVNGALAVPPSALTITGGDVEAATIGNGLILKAPNGSRWRVTVSNTGVLTTTAL